MKFKDWQNERREHYYKAWIRNPKMGVGVDLHYEAGSTETARYIMARDEMKQVREALEGLTNAAVAGIKPLPSQSEAGFNAIAALDKLQNEIEGE